MEVTKTVEVQKAKHTVGDRVHVKLWLNDDKASLIYFGHVMAVRRHKGNLFPDRILYDLELEQVDAPPILLTNVAHGFIIPGGEEVFDENGQEKETA